MCFCKVSDFYSKFTKVHLQFMHLCMCNMCICGHCSAPLVPVLHDPFLKSHFDPFFLFPSNSASVGYMSMRGKMRTFITGYILYQPMAREVKLSI